jgi:hypothetical protein
LNKWLANSLGGINALLAVGIILSGGVAGSSMGGGAGFIVGAIFGAVFAVLVCGFLAIILEIRAQLTEVNKHLGAILNTQRDLNEMAFDLKGASSQIK